MIIKTVEYKDIESMLHDMYCRSGELKNLDSGYIFRGEGSDKYRLLPSALRKSNQNKLLRIASGSSNRSAKKKFEVFQRMAEFELLRKFYLTSNENGLKVYHTNTVSVYERFAIDELLKAVITEPWLPSDLENVAALAQHYGVMTRLLDWTFNFNVAFYFASVNALKNICNNGITKENMVIWALNYDELCRWPINKSMKFVVPPYIDNPNLKAQKGILSYWKSGPIKEENIFTQQVERIPLDDLLYESGPDNEIALYEIKLPITEAYKLFTFANRNGYTTSSIFPGYDGVALECNESEMIDQVRQVLEE